MKMRESTLRTLVRNVIQEDLGMSPSMSRKGDPEYHLKRALKKWNMSDILDTVLEVWNYMSPSSPGALQRMTIEALGWEDIDVPSNETFGDIFKACVRDEKATARRGSYSF